MNLVEFIVWCVAIYGAVNGIAFSTLLTEFRLWWQFSSWKVTPEGSITGVKRTNFFMLKMASFFSCPMCLGFWLGIITSLVWKSPSGGNYLIDAFAASGSAWLIYLATAFRASGR